MPARHVIGEPALGIIKEVIGFRQFMLRGLENVSLEWALVTRQASFFVLWVQ
jgi:hypothetical protein